jgi:hypothetical protein
MALMASVGMVYALYTAQVRRAYDNARQQRPARTGVPPGHGQEPRENVAPAQLAALGYLPPQSNVVAAVHVEELVRNPEALAWLQLSFPIGNVIVGPKEVAGWLGLQPEEIDHLALGVSTSAPLLPAGVLIVRTRASWTVDQMRSKLKAERIPGNSRRHLYRFRVDNLLFQPIVLWINEHTLALAVIPAHLEEVPEQPRKDLDHLPDEVRKLIVERIEPGSTIWVVGAFTEQFWKSLGNPGGGEAANVRRLQAVREFAVGMRMQGKGVRVGAALHTTDEKAAASWQEALKESTPNSSRDGSWVVMQFDTEKMGQELSRMIFGRK